MNTIIRIAAILVLSPFVVEAGDFYAPIKHATWVKHVQPAVQNTVEQTEEIVENQLVPVPTFIEFEVAARPVAERTIVKKAELTDAPLFVSEKPVLNVATSTGNSFRPIHDSRVLSDVVYR